jgi:hypothetical protein
VRFFYFRSQKGQNQMNTTQLGYGDPHGPAVGHGGSSADMNAG